MIIFVAQWEYCSNIKLFLVNASLWVWLKATLILIMDDLVTSSDKQIEPVREVKQLKANEWIVKSDATDKNL